MMEFSLWRDLEVMFKSFFLVRVFEWVLGAAWRVKCFSKPLDKTLTRPSRRFNHSLVHLLSPGTNLILVESPEVNNTGSLMNSTSVWIWWFSYELCIVNIQQKKVWKIDICSFPVFLLFWVLNGVWAELLSKAQLVFYASGRKIPDFSLH